MCIADHILPLGDLLIQVDLVNCGDSKLWAVEVTSLTPLITIFMFQMPDQYVFIHQAVLEYAQREGLLSADAIRLDGFDEESDESPDDST